MFYKMTKIKMYAILHSLTKMPTSQPNMIEPRNATSFINYQLKKFKGNRLATLYIKEISEFRT